MIANLFADLPAALKDEVVTTLLSRPALRIERIVSSGQSSPPGFWYDQAENEWVLVLAGSAGLLFEGEAEPLVMRAGDAVDIPAHRRHRVAWTDPQQLTIWLTVHYA
jgi:cupin 2 domain-containing protein